MTFSTKLIKEYCLLPNFNNSLYITSELTRLFPPLSFHKY
jgi:hypothetical protein